MSLLNPDSGLIFWMLIAFGIVFFVLAKFGFPVIVGMVEKRKQYIDDSLKAAHEANERLVHIKEESESILAKAREEQANILKEAVETRKRIIQESKDQAGAEGNRMLEEARKQIQKEKEDAIRDIRLQVSELSVGIAEKILRQNLDDDQKQNGLIERLLDEASTIKNE